MIQERKKNIKGFFLKLFALIAIVCGIFVYFWFFRPYSDAGVKAGILNNIKHKGVVFKTYEGELIQSGFRSSRQGISSNEFQFSVEDEELAKRLMSMSGQQVRLHYKEYFGALPWRGYSKFIVDSIISVEEPINLEDGANIPYSPQGEF